MIGSALDHILGTTAKVRLLRALLPLETPASGREAERLGNVSHRSASRALDDLVALGILRRTTTPGTHLYQANRENDLVPFLEALFRGEATRLASLREEIEAALVATDLEGTVTSVVLFGSAARGDARPESDLDLLVLVEDRLQSEAASDFLAAISNRLRSRYGARASVLVLSVAEARRRLEAGDALMQNVVHDGRNLFGTPVHEAPGAW
jgi:predicted nucleotidyltransferase